MNEKQIDNIKFYSTEGLFLLLENPSRSDEHSHYKAELHRRINEGREIERRLADEEGMTTAFDYEASDRDLARVTAAREAGRREARDAILNALDEVPFYSMMAEEAFNKLQEKPSSENLSKAYDMMSNVFEGALEAVALALDRNKTVVVKYVPLEEKPGIVNRLLMLWR